MYGMDAGPVGGTAKDKKREQYLELAIERKKKKKERKKKCEL